MLYIIGGDEGARAGHAHRTDEVPRSAFDGLAALAFRAWRLIVAGSWRLGRRCSILAHTRLLVGQGRRAALSCSSWTTEHVGHRGYYSIVYTVATSAIRLRFNFSLLDQARLQPSRRGFRGPRPCASPYADRDVASPMPLASNSGPSDRRSLLADRASRDRMRQSRNAAASSSICCFGTSAPRCFLINSTTSSNDARGACSTTVRCTSCECFSSGNFIAASEGARPSVPGRALGTACARTRSLHEEARRHVKQRGRNVRTAARDR